MLLITKFYLFLVGGLNRRTSGDFVLVSASSVYQLSSLLITVI